MSVLDLFNLTGQVAIVTGGARGLGRQMALALAEAGADVAICDLLEEDGQRTAAELAALGPRSFFGRVDVTRVDQIEAYVEQVIERLGKIDILVNNAGMSSDGLALDEEPDDAWRRMIDTNVSSMFYFGKRVARHMIDRNAGGVIINMASINALVISNISPRHNVPYCVAKAGVAQLTRGMAADWVSYGIRVNAIAPGTMLTAQTAASRKYPEIVERIIANTPMKRYGEEEEIKGLVVYLASPASSFMTGSLVVMDGGTTIW
jgi:NAD(P)-dependent dehydrogenase (short-subunit alcohol dehydrogenase family)